MNLKNFYAIVLAIALTLSLGFVACNNNNDVPDPTPDPLVDEIEIVLPIVEISDNGEIILSSEEQIVTENALQFSFDYMRAMQQTTENENIVTSPLSTYLALSMLANGADNNTFRQIMSAIAPNDAAITDINTHNYKLHKALNILQEGARVEMASGVFAVDDKLNVNINFKNMLEKYYLSEYFSISHESAINDINAWVKTKTNGLIKELIDEDEDLSNVRMVLCNSLYFDATWFRKFNPDASKTYTFTTAEGTEKEAKFMTYTDDRKIWNFYEDETLQLLSLPFGLNNETTMMEEKDCSFDMHIILPTEGRDVTSVINTISPESWKNMINERDKRAVFIRIPVLHAENTIDLQTTLKSLGINDAFSINADFSKISDSNLYVEKFRQKNVFNLSEEGVTAASVTEVELGETGSGYGDWETPIHFYAQRPFIFCITERSTGAILYSGIIKDIK